MIVSIHQPHFLPWMGYFNKVLRSQVFVWLHSVQYRKNYFQNRTQIKNVNEQPLWLTLPVHAKLGMNIDQVMVADPRWSERICKTVEQCYRKAPYFAECWPTLEQSLRSASGNLDEIDFQSFSALLKLLNGQAVQVTRIGDLDLKSDDPTERLVEVCIALGASAYVAGRGGRNYLREDAFERAGIEVLWQDFPSERVVYQQIGKSFVSGLSVIDCLFNVGPIRTRELVLGAWAP